MTGKITATQIDGRTRYSISEPFDIGPRLMPSLKLPDGSRVSITATGRDREGRVTYKWAVDSPEGHVLGTAEDMTSGVGADVDIEDMFSTFASFVGAWVETFDYDDSDNKDLFPDAMRDWADANYEELYMFTSEEMSE